MNKLKRMLVVMAHPDDIEIGCYGLIKKLVLRGAVCYVAIATNGENGLNISDNKKNILNRKEETQNALGCLVEDIIWLGYPDGHMKLDANYVGSIRRVIDEVSPELIVTHFPDDSGIEHQDHGIVGKGTINAAFRYAKTLKYLLLSEPMFNYMTKFKPNLFVDISDVYDDKLQALKQHISQRKKFYMSDYFQNIRSSAITPYINMPNIDSEKKYELFQIMYERFG